MPETVSADHIAAQNGAFEPQRRNNFTLRIEVGENRIIQRSLDAFPLPKEANEVISVNYGNEARKVAGRVTFDDLELVLKDFVDTPTAEAMIAWRRLVYNPDTGAIGNAADYKKEGEVVMFAPDGSRERSWRLMGIWPSRLDPGSGDMNAAEANKITTTLTVDKTKEQF